MIRNALLVVVVTSLAGCSACDPVEGEGEGGEGEGGDGEGEGGDGEGEGAEGEGGEGEGAEGEGGEGEGGEGEGGEGEGGEGEGEGTAAAFTADWADALQMHLGDFSSVVGARFACFDGDAVIFGGLFDGASGDIALGPDQDPPVVQPRANFPATWIARADGAGVIEWARIVDANVAGCGVDGGAVAIGGTFFGAIDIDGHNAELGTENEAAGFVATLDPATGAGTALVSFESDDGFGSSSVFVTRVAAGAGVVAVAGTFRGTMSLSSQLSSQLGSGFTGVFNGADLTPLACTAGYGAPNGQVTHHALSIVGQSAVVAFSVDQPDFIGIDGGSSTVFDSASALIVGSLGFDGVMNSAAVGVDSASFFDTRDAGACGAIDASDGTAYFALPVVDANDGHGIFVVHTNTGAEDLGSHTFPYVPGFDGDRVFMRGMSVDHDGGLVIGVMGKVSSLDFGGGAFDLGDFNDGGVFARVDASYALVQQTGPLADIDVSVVVADAAAVDGRFFASGTYGIFSTSTLDLGTGPLQDFGDGSFNVFAGELH